MPLLVLPLFLILNGCQKPATDDGPGKNANSPTTTDSLNSGSDAASWQPLFKDPELKNWEPIEFGETNRHEIKTDSIRVEQGYQLTGVRFTGDLPTSNYQMELEAIKGTGTDFFCCLTFPVQDQFCSLVVGGWGGTVTGISCIDAKDASDNQTTSFRKYEMNKPYLINVTVTDDKLQCRIDDELVVDLALKGVKLSLRTDVDQCKPLSLCSFATGATWNNFRIQRLENQK